MTEEQLARWKRHANDERRDIPQTGAPGRSIMALGSRFIQQGSGAWSDRLNFQSNGP